MPEYTPRHRLDVEPDSCSAGRRWGGRPLLNPAPCNSCATYFGRHLGTHRAEPTS